LFTQLPKVFDRAFTLGYFLPSLLFILTNALFIRIFSIFDAIDLLGLREYQSFLVDVTVLALISWVLSVLLLAANRGIIRLLEGYGKFNPAQVLLSLEKGRYEKLYEEIDRLKERIDRIRTEGREVPTELSDRQIDLALDRAIRLPREKSQLLPTAFGNTIRAFENYPAEIYGIDAISGWNRLLAVVPKDYRQMVDDAKALMDFWVNIWILCALAALEYICMYLFVSQASSRGFAIGPVRPETVLFLFVLLLCALAASWRARSAATEWGDMIKSAFDVFLPDLLIKLRFPHPKSIEDERKTWTSFSKVFLYCDDKSMINRTQWQQKPSISEQTDSESDQISRKSGEDGEEKDE
jgi:hypothetical protein